MKKTKGLIALTLLVIMLFSLSISTSAEVDYQISNNANVDDWTTVSGTTPSYHKDENNATDGIYLSGTGNGDVFEYTYNKEISRNEIMLDFMFLEENLDYTSNPKITFTFKAEETLLCKFVFTIKEEAYDVSFICGEKTYSYTDLLYKENSHTQFRIAKDDCMNYESGEIESTWNLVIGIPKKTITTKNDKYSIKVNKFENSDFEETNAFLDEVTDKTECNLTIEATSSANTEIGLLVSQVGTENFYNCFIYPNTYIDVYDVNYTQLNFVYEIPEGVPSYQGFIIKRYHNGEYEATYQYSNKYANSLSEKYLKQATEYEYEIMALESVSTSNRVACSKIVFKYEPIAVTTQSGDIKNMFIAIGIVVGVSGAIVLGYIFRFEIQDLFKKLFQKLFHKKQAK